MSQICKIVTKISSIGDVQEACRMLGWTLHQGGHLRWYMSQQGEEMDYTIEMDDSVVNRYGERINKKYNIGLLRQGDGSFELRHDNAMNGAEVPGAMAMDDTTSAIIGKLKQAVAQANLQRQLQAKKFRVEHRIMADGTVHIVGRR